jgi:cytochrome c oxidase subunit 4
MSAPAAASTSDHGHAEPSKLYTYIGIAMILGVMTGVEIVLVYLPLPHWFVFSALAILSAVKFMFVIFYFMHLRWDKVFCTILFFIGLVLAAGTMWALLHLFGAEASKPLSSAAVELARATLA